MSNYCLFFEYSLGISVSGLFYGGFGIRGSGFKVQVKIQGLRFKV